jgi:hypothetical protein
MCGALALCCSADPGAQGSSVRPGPRAWCPIPTRQNSCKRVVIPDCGFGNGSKVPSVPPGPRIAPGIMLVIPPTTANAEEVAWATGPARRTSLPSLPLVSAKTQPVSALRLPEFRILEFHRAETRPENLALRCETPGIPRQRPGSWLTTSGNVDTSPSAGNPYEKTGLAGWGARIRTWEWRNQNPLPYHLATPHFCGAPPRAWARRREGGRARADHTGMTASDQSPGAAPALDHPGRHRRAG